MRQPGSLASPQYGQGQRRGPTCRCCGMPAESTYCAPCGADHIRSGVTEAFGGTCPPRLSVLAASCVAPPARPPFANGYRCGMNEVEQVPRLLPDVTVTFTFTR